MSFLHAVLSCGVTASLSIIADTYNAKQDSKNSTYPSLRRECPVHQAGTYVYNNEQTQTYTIEYS